MDYESIDKPVCLLSSFKGTSFFCYFYFILARANSVLFMVKRPYEMIENFEKETKDLTDYEKRILLPIMVKCLANHKGKDMAVSNALMCAKMSECGYQISDCKR